jgi:parallel beta-helix repeat protein
MRIVCKSYILLFILFVLFSKNAFAKSYSKYIKEGNSHYKKKKYFKALTAYKKAEKEAKGNINVFFNLGLVNKQIKDYPTAVEYFKIFLNLSNNKKMIATSKKLLTEMETSLTKPTTSGKLKHYEVWDGWILIEGDVIVPRNIVLTIKPGSIVMFAPLSSRYEAKMPYLKKEDTQGLSSLIVRGKLIAEGERDNEILFSNSFEDKTTKKLGLWGGIVFEKSGDSILKYSKVERSKNGVVFKSNPNLLFKNNVFLKNETAIKLLDNSYVSIEYNIFFRNGVGVDCRDKTKVRIVSSNFTKNNFGVKTSNLSDPEIIKSTFSQNNSGIGIYKKSFPTISENAFEDNKFGIFSAGDSKPVIKDNKFIKNSTGIKSADNSAPKIYKNIFNENTSTGVTATGNSKARIDANTFNKNKTAITKVDSAVATVNNMFKDNKKDIKEIH